METNLNPAAELSAQTEFAATIAANAQANAHAIEIQQTRIGGLGGSDASLIFKIGSQGMATLTQTDMKRIAVMMNLAKPNDFGGNVHTNAGHLFEDYAEKFIPWGARGYEREKVLSKPLARNFKTFAHADFVTGAENLQCVIECKFVQDTLANVMKKYHAQLQWYYLMGADHVSIYHGTGTAEPFEVETGRIEPIMRDEQTMKILLNGVSILDKAIESGWKPDVQDKIALQDTPEIIQRAFDKMSEIKAKRAELDKEEEEAKAILKEYIEDFGFTGIVSAGDVKRQVVYTMGKTNYKFNAEKFLAEHPEFNLPQYFKQIKTKASISFK